MPAERPLLAYSRKDLDLGPKVVRQPLPEAWLTNLLAATASDATDEEAERPDVVAKGDAAIDARLSPSGGEQILLTGRVKAALQTTCGRCLGPALVAVDASMTLLLVPKVVADRRAPKGKAHQESEGEFEFEGDEADVATYDGETVILDDLVREALLLELPISLLCSEDCAGMSADPAVAAKLAAARIDPRLAPLAALLVRDGAAATDGDDRGGKRS